MPEIRILVLGVPHFSLVSESGLAKLESHLERGECFHCYGRYGRGKNRPYDRESQSYPALRCKKQVDDYALIPGHGSIIGGKRADHKDRDPWNNLDENLRPATSRLNSCNRTLNRNSTTGYAGVVKRPNGTYNAQWSDPTRGRVQGRKEFKIARKSGFVDPIEAAHFRDKRQLEVCGEYAALNFENLRPLYLVEIEQEKYGVRA